MCINHLETVWNLVPLISANRLDFDFNYLGYTATMSSILAVRFSDLRKCGVQDSRVTQWLQVSDLYQHCHWKHKVSTLRTLHIETESIQLFLREQHAGVCNPSQAS